MNDMIITWLGRGFPIFCIIAYIGITFYRAKSAWRTNERVVTLMMICNVLLLISSISAVPKPVTLITDVIRMSTMLFSMFIAYIVMKHLYEEKKFISLPKNPFFSITIAVCLLVLFADLNRDNFGVITDNDSITVTPLYAISVIASYALMSYFSITTTYLLVKTAVSTKYLVYRTRLSTSIIAFIAITVCCLGVIANIILAYNGNFDYRNTLNIVYHYGKLIYFPFMFVAIMLPNNTVNYLLKPVHLAQQSKIRREQQDIRYLHEKMLSIVPSVGLNYGQTHVDDMIVEIADARMTLWTNIRHEGKSSPDAEADVIHDFLRRGIILDKPGEHPPVQPPTDEVNYNLKVARRLKSLV